MIIDMHIFLTLLLHFLLSSLQYEWDLSINWVSLHIDGVANAKQISQRAEVDLEMVRACLRVLKQHNVVHLIDMFCYSNRYQWTGRTLGPDTLHDAVDYVIKHAEVRVSPPAKGKGSLPSNRSGEDNEATLMVDSFVGTSLPSDRAMQGSNFKGSSLPNNDCDSILAQSSAMKPDEYMEIQNAIVEFYAACHRDVPISEVWIAFITKRQTTATGLPTIRNTIRWKKVFRLIDHRRLITFGLIHGYIIRFHNFPLLVHRNNNDLDDDPSTPKYNHIQRQKSSSSYDRIGRGSSHHSYLHHIKSEQAVRRTQSKQLAASLMDGTHCDDEIACTVEMPLDEVRSMFPPNSIVSVFAAR
jgi:hypothetical protein